MKPLNLSQSDLASEWHVVRNVNKWVVLMGGIDSAAQIGGFSSKSRCKEFLRLNKIKAIIHGVDDWLSDKS